MKNYVHICNKGNNVIFREKQDYVYFINKFAIAMTSHKIRVLAITVMATHFHTIVIESDNKNLDDVIAQIKKSYAIYYNHKYGESLNNAIQTSFRTFQGNQNIENEMLYVLRNPMHHYVTSSPFSYPFSSASCLYKDCLITGDFEKWGETRYRPVKELSYKEYRRLFGCDKAPDNFQIDPNGMITFESFVNQSIAKSFWNGYKNYFWSMLSTIKDTTSQVIDQDCLDTRTDAMSDIDVCHIIDNQACVWELKSFHFFNQEQLDYVINLLKRRNVNQQQIERCLWIKL